MPDSNLHKLSALGQSVWIDYLSRGLLQTGELERMMREDAVVGVTRPDAFAAARVSPFPCDTATERALGRTTITTGIPTRSRPVTLAMRVMPIRASSGRRRASGVLRGADAMRAVGVALGARRCPRARRGEQRAVVDRHGVAASSARASRRSGASRPRGKPA